MPRFIDRTGTTRGRLTYLRLVGKNKFKQSLWEALCSCGKIVIVQASHTESCGCLLIERNHGPKPHTPEHCQKISEAKRIKDVEMTCPQCGIRFVGTAAQRFCCLEHGKKFRGKFDGRRERHWTRKTGAKYQAVDFWKVFERDKGICQICWLPVLRELRGAIRDSQAPTLDHGVPLSKGGDHTYENVRLAHYGCNNEKSDKIPEGIVPVYSNPDTRTRIEKIREETRVAMQRPDVQIKLHAPRPNMHAPRPAHSIAIKASWARRKAEAARTP